jgi:hypothetical protein
MQVYYRTKIIQIGKRESFGCINFYVTHYKTVSNEHI